MDSSNSAALIAAGAGLLAVVLTALGAALVARSQLKHDREERAKDRALQSKRERLFTALDFANDAMRAITKLGNAEITINQVATDFGASASGLNSAGGVASLEVIARGRDLIGHAGRLVLLGMAKRRRLELQGKPGSPEWAAFGDWIVNCQIEMQATYALLLAAIRRDLGIEGSLDEAVMVAIRVDAEALTKAAAEAKAVLNAGG